MSSAPCAKRGGKSKAPLPASNLFALGESSSGIGQKRGPPLSSKDALVGVKRPKVFKRQSGEWEDNAIEVDSESLLKKVIEAESSNDETRIEKYLCGAIKKLRNNRSKQDSILSLCLMYIAKTRPQHFLSENIIDALCSILKNSTPSASLKLKTPDLAPLLVANILCATHQNEQCWHLAFVEAYIEDSLGARAWVDNDACKAFVNNIMTAFNTRMPPKSLLSQDILAVTGLGASKGANDSPASTSPPHLNEDSIDETSSSSLIANEIKEKFDAEIETCPRFSSNHQVVTDYVVETINEQLTRRSAPSEINRNLLKLLMSTVGIPQVRLLVVNKIEVWLQNPKLSRSAQDLLLAICCNCTKDDADVVAAMVKMRLKNKQLINHLMLSIREFLGQNNENLMTVMRGAILNEFSSRASSNIQLIALLFQHSSNNATKSLALLVHEFLLKEDYLRHFRTLIREIIRHVKPEHLNLSKLVSALTEDNSMFVDVESHEAKTRILTSLADLIPLCMFLVITPSVKESLSKPERREILRQTQTQIAEIQRLSIIWMQKIVTKVFKPERNEFMHCLNKCLIMERAECYYDKDGWPSESDRNPLFRLTTEVPLHEDSLTRILKMGLSKDYPLQSSEAIELADNLIKRAAATFDGDPLFPTLLLKKDDIFGLLLKSTIYRIPENITLPSDYEPPSMAIIDCYWKVWIQLLIITAFNSSKFGHIAWGTYPTLAILIEMCITSQFDFPPATRQNEDLKSHELQIVVNERAQILQFESHLAASSKRQINETNSLLLSKLITFDPQGKPRHPPAALLEDLKNLNSHLKLGYWLCQSRDPDFLLEIIGRQQKRALTTSFSSDLELEPMQWLNDLIEMNCENLATLPVLGLSEFTLRYVHEEEKLLLAMNELKQNEKNRRRERRKKFCRVLEFFNNALNTDLIVTKQAMEYFLQLLSSPQANLRALASKSLYMILYYDENMIDNLPSHFKSHPEAWLIGKLPTMANFESIKEIACTHLLAATKVETDSEAFCCYIQFLAEFGAPGDKQTILEIARSVHDRGVTFRHLAGAANHYRDDFLTSCIKLFYDYMAVAESQPDDDATASPQDHILVKWEDGHQAVLHVVIVHAMICILCYDPPQNQVAKKQWEELVQKWLSNPMPVSYILGSSEEAILLPDWLKLKLLRSSSPILIEAGLKESDYSQLLIFVQSFGIPVSSMEKLLQTLDEACESDLAGVQNSITNESFLKGVIEVQWVRGVKSGRKFAENIGLLDQNDDSNECDPFFLATDAFENNS